MRKICFVGNCVNPVWGTDKNNGLSYCAKHQWKRTDLKKKPFKPLSEKKPVHYFDLEFTDQTTMFWYLFKSRQNEDGTVTCKFTGEKLQEYSPFYFGYFAHILPKKNYPYFKLNPDNVEIVHQEFHRIIDQGSSKDRALHPDWKWDEWDRKVLEMKSKYQAFKKKNLLP